jgi:hypothetical protein
MRTINKIKIFPEQTIERWSLGRTRRWLLRIKNHLEGMEKVEERDSYWYKNDKDDLERHIKMLEKQIEIKEKEGVKVFDYTNEDDDLSG